MSEQLTDELAREIAARHIARLRRAHVACRFASSRRPAELARSYDTIVIDSPRFHSISNVSIHSQAAQAICDTLLVLRAVVHCPRFALRENASFWWDLIQEPDELVPQLFNCFTTRATTRVFPRIVFSGLLLRSYTPPLDSVLLSSLTSEECAVSEEAKSDISMLKIYSNEPKEPIEWVAHMRFEPNISSTKAVLEVISRYARTAISSDTSPFRWVGIMLLGKVVDMNTKRGIELVQMKAVSDLCAAVPDSIQVEVRFPFSFRGSSYPQSHTVMESHHLQPYLRHAYGFHGSPFTGRMQVLDLVNAFQGTNRGFEPNIVSVCTMIPFMTSLRELRMCVNQTADLVWLAYALFHPRSKISKWKSLILSGKRQSEHPRFAPQPIEDVDWSVLTTVANSSNLLATVLLLTRPSMEPSKTPDSRQIRTASIVKRAQVYTSWNKQLTALTPGTLVEVCDIKPPENELIPDATIVMVPGFGFGTVSASYLKNEARVPVPEHPKTKISALQVENLEIPSKYRGDLLKLFSPTLRHFCSLGSIWFNGGVRIEDVASLRSLDLVQYEPQVTPRLLAASTQLRSLGLVCCQNEFDSCAKMLINLHYGLVLLRLHVLVDRSADDSMEQSLSTGIKRLLEDMPSLQSALIARVPPRQNRSRVSTRMRTADRTRCQRLALEDIPRSPSLTRSECALLSVISRANSVDPLARLDSMVVRVIFSFWSTNLQWAHICEHSPVATISADESRTIGDAWVLGRYSE